MKREENKIPDVDHVLIGHGMLLKPVGLFIDEIAPKLGCKLKALTLRKRHSIGI